MFFTLELKTQNCFSPCYGRKAIKFNEDKVMFFGGGQNGFLKDIIIYDLRNESYERFPSLSNDAEELEKDTAKKYFKANCFTGIGAFDAVLLDGKIYIFGGITEDNKYSNTLYQLDDSLELKVIQQQGSVPSARLGHTLTKIGTNKILLFGGVEKLKTNFPHFLNDVYVLTINAEDFVWEKIQISSHSPCPRESHSAVLYDKYVTIFGGMNGTFRLNDLWQLNVESFEWSSRKCSGVLPAGRSMHTANLVGSNMYIFGGFISSYNKKNETWSCTNSLYYLNLETHKWNHLAMKKRPEPRAGHCSIENCGRIYIWSGRAQNSGELTKIKCYNDLWCLETSSPKDVENITLLEKTTNSLHIQWSPVTNAVCYLVEICSDQQIIEESVVEKSDQFVEINENLETTGQVIVKKPPTLKEEPRKKPKIIIHSHKVLKFPNLIPYETLIKFEKSGEKNIEVEALNVEQVDGLSDLLEDFELTESETESRNIIKDGPWNIVGIFKQTTCNIESYVVHSLNRNTLTSENIPNLIDYASESLISGSSYFIRVSAMNSCGISDYSAIPAYFTTDTQILIYDMILEHHPENFYFFAWSSLMKDVEFVVNLAVIFNDNHQIDANVYKGKDFSCIVQSEFFTNTNDVLYYEIQIQALSTKDGAFLYSTGLHWEPVK